MCVCVWLLYVSIGLNSGYKDDRPYRFPIRVKRTCVAPFRVLVDDYGNSDIVGWLGLACKYGLDYSDMDGIV